MDMDLFGNILTTPRLAKVDAEGSIEWDRIVLQPLFWTMYGLSVDQTLDGGYVLAAVGQEWLDFGSWDLGQGLLIKTDPLGKTQWMRRFGDESYFCCVRAVSDCGIVAAGDILESGDYHARLIKTDPFGHVAPSLVP